LRTKLSEKFVQNSKQCAPGAQLDIWDAILPGFGLRIGARKKTFVVMIRVGSVKRRITLGDYPALSLGKGREKAQEVMRHAENGVEPTTIVEQMLVHGETVGTLVSEFLEKHCKKNNRDWRKQKSIFELDVLPQWKNRDIRSISRRDCINLLERAAARNSEVTANRVRAQVNSFFNWLAGRDVIAVNPMQKVPPPGKEMRRDRVLVDGEIRPFWECCTEAGHPFGNIFKLLLITGQRRDEVGRMRWSDIDWKTKVWTIPAENSKNGIANELPLSPLAVATLEAVPIIDLEGYIFPAANGSGKPASGYSKAKARLDRAIGARRKEAGAGSIVPNWWLHDLRRTAASGMARLGIAPHVIERVLNHITGQLAGVAGIYNRHGYLPEKRHALETWATHLEKVIVSTPFLMNPTSFDAQVGNPISLQVRG
jgi:integrase